jgi:hypothetical protein
VEKLKMYNQFMYKLNCLLIALVFVSKTYAADTAETAIQAQQDSCAKNTAMEWSATLNRCVAKQKAIETRHAVQECEAITDAAAKAKCHMNIAEGSTGMSSDTKKLNQGKTTQSMMMNGVAAAYTAINMISSMGKDGEKSNCTSKKILGITSVAGLASDVYLKMMAKKKIKSLEDKYKLDTTTGTTEAQVSALQYLKEEQQTVVEIAGMEKKRNLALMLGYGMAAGWAVYEMTSFGMNPNCVKPNDGKTLEASADTPGKSVEEIQHQDLPINDKIKDLPAISNPSSTPPKRIGP